MRKRTLRPFALLLVCFLVMQFSGMAAMRAYLVQIFAAYGMPISPNWSTVVVGLMGLVANIVCMGVVRVIGKRKLFFFSLAGASVCCFGLSFYAYTALPAGWSSFDKHEATATRAAATAGGSDPFIAMVMFFGLAFFTGVGVAPLPWILLSEMFPFK